MFIYINVLYMIHLCIIHFIYTYIYIYSYLFIYLFTYLFIYLLEKMLFTRQLFYWKNLKTLSKLFLSGINQCENI